MTLLERLKELAGKATPGPWEVSKDFPWVVVAPEPAKLGKGHVYFSCSCGGGNNEENAVYLTSALNALPDLIAVVEAAMKVDASITATYNASRYSVSRSKADVLAAALAKLEVEA